MTTKQLQSFEVFLLIIVVFAGIGIIFQNNILLFAAGFFIVHLVLTSIYDKSFSKNLYLRNKKQTIRLFTNEEAVWSLQFENHSLFPLINGEINFNVGSSIRVLGGNKDKEKYWERIKLPVSIMARKNVKVAVPIAAEKRGTARVSHLTYRFPHLFTFQKVALKYYEQYETEFIVYPQLKRVIGLETVFHMNPGETRTKFSPFEDIQSPIGTREYHDRDAFQHINWKASVRTQVLQTNIYEKVIEGSFVFFVNIKQNTQIGAADRLENLLSYTAFLCKHVTEQKLSYELFINAFYPGRRPFIQQKEGNDRKNLLQSLELLARIPRQPACTPFEQILYQAANTLQQPKTIIILGDIPEGAKKQLQRLKKLRHTIFQVIDTEESAMIAPLKMERTA
ncbi:DUF58 domain-containing protein [Ralstonia pickettii]|nr:DUF58 domain-containing protein [Ralstonia pickettii]